MKYLKTILSRQMVHDAYEEIKFNPDFPDSYIRFEVPMLLSDILKQLAFIVGKNVQEFRVSGTIHTYDGVESPLLIMYTSAEDLFLDMGCGGFDDLTIDLYEDQGHIITTVKSDIGGDTRHYQIESILSSSITPFDLQASIESFIAYAGPMIDYLTPSIAETLCMMGFNVPRSESYQFGSYSNFETWQCAIALDSTFYEWYRSSDSKPEDGTHLRSLVFDYFDSLLRTQPKETLDYYEKVVYGFELINFNQIHHHWTKEDH